MLKIDKTVEGGCMTVALVGDLDTISSVMADREIGVVSGLSSVVFDMSGVSFVSSSGIRVLLGVRKRMSPGSKLSLRGLQPAVRQILTLCGLTKLISCGR